MLRRALFFMAGILILFPPAESRAARFSGEYILQVCGSDEKGNELVKGGHIACQGYIAGVVDYHNLVRSLGTAPSVDFCIPENVSMQDLQKQVYSYVARNRYEHSKFIAAPAIALALFERWPCNKKSSGKKK